MADLSPAAQAVRRDLAQIMAELHQRCRISISRTDVLPITLETNDAALQAGINSLCADALRAAADQVVPEADIADKEEWNGQSAWQQAEYCVRFRLLALATELDPTP